MQTRTSVRTLYWKSIGESTCHRRELCGMGGRDSAPLMHRTPQEQGVVRTGLESLLLIMHQ